MKLIIVRHGVSEQTWERIIDGAKDLPLSKKGIEQIKKVATHFDESKIDYVFSSPLERAYKTAKLLTKNKKQIIIDERIIELRMGKWIDQANKIEANKKSFDAFSNVQSNYTKYAKNAESFQDIKSRCLSFINFLLTNYSTKTVLVASHGIAIRAMFSVIFKQNMNEIMNMNNVAFTEIYFDKDKSPMLMDYNSKYPTFFAQK